MKQCMCDGRQKKGRTDERTDGKLNSRSRIYMIYIKVILHYIAPITSLDHDVHDNI